MRGAGMPSPSVSCGSSSTRLCSSGRSSPMMATERAWPNRASYAAMRRPGCACPGDALTHEHDVGRADGCQAARDLERVAANEAAGAVGLVELLADAGAAVGTLVPLEPVVESPARQGGVMEHEVAPH